MRATAGTALVSGTLLGNVEQQVVDGDATIVIALTDDSWLSTIGDSADAATDSLIDGIVSAQVETTGWNLVVQAALSDTNVERNSDTVVTITLPAFSSYSTDLSETITVTIPAAALGSFSSIEATPDIEILSGGEDRMTAMTLAF